MTSLPRPDGVGTRRATMKEVARLAGVGTKTVSRVVNAEPNVSEATASAVWNAIRALDYHVDMQAGSLRRAGGRTRTIGLLISSVDNPFAGAIHRAVETAARAQGLSVLAASLDDDPDREVEAVREFLRRRVDGLILTTASADLHSLVPTISQGIPVVFVDRRPVGLNADVVASENRAAAARGVRHLIEHGHRRLALIVDNISIDTASERKSGALAEADRSGLAADEVQVHQDIHSPDDSERLVTAMMASPEPPTAILGAQNLITLGATRALHRLGLQHRVALVGFDDLPLAELVDPGITVLEQDASAIGRIAAQRLFRRMDGEQFAVEEVMVPVRLIQRGSGEISPAASAQAGR